MQWDKEIKSTIVYEVEKQPGYEQPHQEVPEEKKDHKWIGTLTVTILTILLDMFFNICSASMSTNKKGGKE